MFEIREVPVSKVLKRKLVMGVGINDMPYQAVITVAGKTYKCPYYAKWVGILERAYSATLHKKKPTYVGTTVCDEWLTFSNFRAWMVKQDWVGKHLDKDLINYNNYSKEYSPENCVFIPAALNNLLTRRENHRGKYPLGVSLWDHRGKYYCAHISRYGKQERIGYFHTIEEAAEAYKEAKASYIKELAEAETNNRIKEALLRLI